MEFKIKEIEAPKVIEFNYDELKNELLEKTNEYKATVYDARSIADAKKDRANLNNLEKAVNSKRIDVKNEYLSPYMIFEEKVKELCNIIHSASATIDLQIKDFEKAEANKKIEAIQLYFDLHNKFEWLKLEDIYCAKWTNKSYKLKAIYAEIEERFEEIRLDLDQIGRLVDFSEDATAKYKKTLDIKKAFEESQRLCELKRRIDEEKERKEEEKSREKEYVRFKSEQQKEDVNVGVKKEESAKKAQIITIKFIGIDPEQANKLVSFLTSEKIKFEIA